MQRGRRPAPRRLPPPAAGAAPLPGWRSRIRAVGVTRRAAGGLTGPQRRWGDKPGTWPPRSAHAVPAVDFPPHPRHHRDRAARAAGPGGPDDLAGHLGAPARDRIALLQGVVDTALATAARFEAEERAGRLDRAA